MKTYLLRFTVVSSFVLAIAAAGHAATLNVPADYPTIQLAIDSAEPGDTVLVSPGTYVENISFMGKGITVKSTDGPEGTIIDGGSSAMSVVQFSNGEGPDSVLDGFSVTNGMGTFIGSYTIGGGVYCNVTSPTITGNMIYGNRACYGGGIGCIFGGSPTILGNIISDNEAKGLSNSGGGGIVCTQGVFATISDNTITSNTVVGTGSATIGAAGGGMNISYGSKCTITRNVIMLNKAEYGGGIVSGGNNDTHSFIANNVVAMNTAGGGNTGEGSSGGGLLISIDGRGTICGNLIYMNKAVLGGGFSCIRYSDSIFTNNTLYGNKASLMGGGINCSLNSILSVMNTIAWENTAPSGPELRVGPDSSLAVDYSDVKGGEPQVSIDPRGTLNWGSNNIVTDPLFVAMAQYDLHVKYTSPCRDTGDSSAVPAGLSDDFEGDPRCCGTVDMGCDEFNTHLYVTGDKTPGGAIEGKLVGSPNSSPVGLFVGSGVLPSPVNTMWGEYWLQAPWILIPLLLQPYGMPLDGILVLTTTLPPSIPAPYDLPMQALIGAELSNLYVLEVR